MGVPHIDVVAEVGVKVDACTWSLEESLRWTAPAQSASLYLKSHTSRARGV